MKKSIFFCLALAILNTANAQNIITPTDNLVTENIPELSSTYLNELKNYTESRAASLFSVHPLKKEILISTRFGKRISLT